MSTKCQRPNCGHGDDHHKSGVGMCTTQDCHCNKFQELVVIRPTMSVVDMEGVVGPAGATVVLEVQPADVAATSGVCRDCPIGGRDGSGPVCTNVEKCDRECAESIEVDAEDASDVGEVPADFIRAINAIFEAGLAEPYKGPPRYAGSWKELTEAEASQKLLSALRHLANGEYDSAAGNALILWWHFQRKGGDDGCSGT